LGIVWLCCKFLTIPIRMKPRLKACENNGTRFKPYRQLSLITRWLSAVDLYG
jgi:hypothetical protein